MPEQVHPRELANLVHQLRGSGSSGSVPEGINIGVEIDDPELAHALAAAEGEGMPQMRVLRRAQPTQGTENLSQSGYIKLEAKQLNLEGITVILTDVEHQKVMKVAYAALERHMKERLTALGLRKRKKPRASNTG